METADDQQARITELTAQLEEANEVLAAIQSGAVDGLVVSGTNGEQVFTLQGAEMPYRILVEEMNQGALMLIPDGTIFYANTRFAALCQTPLEKVIGSSWKEFFPLDKYPELDTCLTAAEPLYPPHEISLRVADGSFCPVQLSLRSLSTSGVVGFSVIVTDLTERKQSETALRKTSAELEEKNSQLEAFSYSISHDMRAPLRAMQGYANLLIEDYGDKLEPEPKSYVERIRSSAKHLDRLINDVLAYSKLSSDEHETATFDLNEMVQGVVDNYPNPGNALIEIVPSSARVRGYEVPLGQCISNLLGNAIKFIPPGRVPSVKVWTEPTNGRFRLWFEDNGIGILPKDQIKIFGLFSRLHTNAEYEGTGIGLSMVKKAVEQMGGHVGVESELGKGSRFWIELESA
ncbi:MAG: sensor signal transduction histidine kinase [Verrucomicrobiales bacterium]|nr:sensor signal transduction histidine kinase [Verrucomicrobiales bacterium]